MIAALGAAVPIQTCEGSETYLWSVLVLTLLMAFSVIVVYALYCLVPNWISSGMPALKKMLARIGITGHEFDNVILDKAIETAGYSYDEKQDIFYSNLDPWQRNMGYCRVYDETAAILGMIIDCEPIYFEYDGKRWLIEFWKGQYDLNTGCEIGVYSKERTFKGLFGIFYSFCYHSAGDADLLQMSFTLKKNDKILFEREDRHWWLTGFKLGEFSDPSELTMDLKITLKDRKMRNKFLKGLNIAGYSAAEIIINKNTVGLKFDKPHTPHPFT